MAPRMAIDAPHSLRIMVHSIETAKAIHPAATRAGDIHLDWDPKDLSSVQLAREAFERALKRGYAAFKMDRKDKQAGSPITLFDPAAERLLLIPQIVGG